MTEIYLIRHAQAEGNLYRMLQGHWDGNVTALGLRQIDALAERFKDVKVDALYSSDLLRTRLTAGAITKYHDLPLHTDKRLREINVGPWETAFMGNVVHDDPETFRMFVFDPEHFHLDGAETYHQVGERALRALGEIAAKHEGESIVVVSHGVTLRCILSAITGTSLNDVKTLPIFNNTGVAHLYYENGKYSVDYYNDASHLTPELMPNMTGPALRDEYIDPKLQREYYTSCYADAWRAAHGDLRGYNGDTYFESACRHYAADSKAVCHAYVDNEDAGLLDLDTERGAHAGYGWISLLYLKPEFRSRGCGIQLLARAITRYEALGRRAIRLSVSEDNETALNFYAHWGFEKLSYENAGGSKLWLLEKKL